MTTEIIQMGPMTKVFKHWQNLVVAAVLLAVNLSLVAASRDMTSDMATAVQGWAILIVAGYAFVAALFLAVSTISEHSALPQVLPGIFNQAKLFIVGALVHGVGYFLINSGAILPTTQIIVQILAILVGAGLVLVAAIIAVSAAFEKLTK